MTLDDNRRVVFSQRREGELCSADIVELRVKGGLNDHAVQKEVQSIWEALRTNDPLKKAAREAGLDERFLRQHERAPFIAERPEAQFGVAETIVISVAAGVLTHVTKNVLDALWDRVIWPRLQRRFGADLEPKENVGSG